MYNLDLTNVAPSPVYPLDDRFRGKDPDGHEVGFTNAYMTIDGKPFFGISGEMHHERMSPDQWEDSVIKMKNGGINIISVYVFWIVHEEEEGIFRFDGQRDIRKFLEICEKYNMMVIMRVGPFNHGEMRNGGLPDWLYGKPYEVRKDNPGFLAVVRRYFRELHKQMDGHYYSQGGCIVGTQIENEYQHSCAPWEITTGISNEWITLGGSGEKYMLALKKIMIEEGIITPFYTTTAWGGAVTPVEEALPLWGGYSYQPWLFYEKDGVHPATPEYIYRDNHNSAVTKEYNFEPSYDPGTRPYACCEMMGGMMCSYRYRFQLDMRAVDALANTKLGSGCNLLGYYVYKGGTNPLGKRTPFLNEGQITKRSYDYQAAVGEFGQIRESYGRLRAIHLFCNTFSGSFEDMKAVLPEHLKGLEPEDLGPLRFSVRIKDSSGFLFINNFQDHIEMKDRRGDEVVLSLPDGDIVFRFDIAAGENAILPFNMDLGGLKLDWATAQPMAKVGDTWFFLAPDGMAPKYSICGRVIEAEAGKSFTVGHITVMTLSRKDSLGFNVIDICGRKAAVLCDRPLLWDGNRMAVEFEEGDADLYMYPAGLLKRPEDAEPLEKDLFEGFRIKSGKKICPASFHSTGYGRYVVDLPEKGLLGHKQVMLRVGYVGDIASAFINGEMISDNFSNGGKWDIRVDNEAERLKNDPLTIYITPKKENVVVDTSAMAGLQERVGSMTAELLSAEWVEVDEIRVM
ncbi:MAG: beta-galactosidase [Christensenellaceae bacterium]|nr:beta-galactosidase [Christensenellaceae bacterium]